MAETFDKFIVLHEKRMMTKEVDKMEKLMTSTTNRASSTLGSKGGNELKKAIAKMMNGLEDFQKVLAKNEMYDMF